MEPLILVERGPVVRLLKTSRMSAFVAAVQDHLHKRDRSISGLGQTSVNLTAAYVIAYGRLHDWWKTRGGERRCRDR